MLRRKALFVADRSQFDDQLRTEIARHAALAYRKRLRAAVRLNVASDLDWAHIAREFPDVQFYDYTKVRSRLFDPSWPSNYQLTYSVNERTDTRTVRTILDSSLNAAVVFSTRYWPQGGRIDTLPVEWRIGRKYYPVVDGDRFDVRLRQLDGAGVVVGLRFKGSLRRRALAIANGFCVSVGDIDMKLLLQRVSVFLRAFIDRADVDSAPDLIDIAIELENDVDVEIQRIVDNEPQAE
jgi:hypothetical protein